MQSWNRSTSLGRGLGAGFDRCLDPLDQGKIPPCFANVSANLLTQGVDGIKFDFIAQPFEKEQLNLRLGRERNGMKVEQVRFDGKRVCAEGWAVTNVRHRVEAFFANTRARDVDAVRNPFPGQIPSTCSRLRAPYARSESYNLRELPRP